LVAVKIVLKVKNKDFEYMRKFHIFKIWESSTSPRWPWY